MEKIIGRVPLGPRHFNKRHGEHALLAQGVVEHFAVALLKDMERQQRVRKKERARQWHDGHFVG